MKLPSLFNKRNIALSQKANPIGMLLYQTGIYRGSFWQLNDYVNLGLDKNPTVKECVKKIAGGASSVPIKLKLRKGEDVKEIAEHPILDLINKPNPMQTKQAFMEYMFTSYLVAGNSYVLSAQMNDNAAPVELWTADFRAFKIKPGITGIPQSYSYTGSTGIKEFPVNPITGMSQVFHAKTINMTDPDFGISPLMSTRVWLDVSNQGSEWNASLLENGARPTGALKTDASLTDEQFHQLKERIDSSWTGVRNSGKPLLLEGGMDWKEMAMSAKDMDFLGSLNYSDKKICGIYGVPYILISEDASTYNNVEIARSILWEDTITPFLDSFMESFGFWLLPKFKLEAAPLGQQGYFLEADYSKVPAYESKESSKTERIMDLFENGILTRNEVRKELGYDALDGEAADEIYIPSSMIPLDSENNDVNGALDVTNQMFKNPPPAQDGDEKPNEDEEDGNTNGKPAKKAARSRKRP